MAAQGQGTCESDAGTRVGIEYWRIENLNPVKQDNANMNTLFAGDCYIFLKTEQAPGSSSLQWSLFFWLGAESSQDEQGGAALRAVELDDQLGGGPVQFRETMGNESSSFVSMFPNHTIITKPGGVDSAFNKVERDNWPTRLLQVKGKRDCKVTTCKEVAWTSMNQGDCFILDMGLKMYLWNGKEANKYEKTKAAEVMKMINDNERGARAQIFRLDDAIPAEVAEALGSGSPMSAEEGGNDSAVQTSKEQPKLIKISDEGGELKTETVNEGKMEYSMLDDNDAFILDTVTDIYVWIGSGASKDERRNGMKYGMDYVKSKGTMSANIQKFNAGHESSQFKRHFHGWPSAAKKAAQNDVSALYAKAQKQEDAFKAMDGRVVSVWRIKDMKKDVVDEKEWGQLYQGDCFIILYTYKLTPSKDGHIIYFWQGKDSSVDEKGASALLSKELDDEMGGDPVQVRVPSGKEPAHFLSMWGRPLCVHTGGVASGFKNRADVDSFDTDGTSLYHVRGNTDYNTRAVQVEEVAASLNSGDVFVLLTPDVMYVWNGSGANDQEKAVGKTISDMMKGSRTEEILAEGSESEGFWAALGGKGEYATVKEVDVEEEPRLFQMSLMGSNGFRVTEINDYDQTDLKNDDVMMLDVGSAIFLWIGSDSPKEEQDAAMKTAMQYVEEAPSHDNDTPIYRVSAGFEPPQFTMHFLGWDASKTGNLADDPYLKLVAAQGGGAPAGGLTKVTSDSIGYKTGATFPLAELQAGIPPGVDPKAKENYLSDEDFQAAFAMDKAAFDALPGWKKTAAKKKAKLF
jgi:villin 1/advillin